MRRVVYLAYLGSVVLTTVLCFIGVCLESLPELAWAVAAGAGLLALRHWLVNHPAETASDSEAEEDWVWEHSDERKSADPKVGELVNLLQEMQTLEKSRGSRQFDPWALRSVRNEIRTMVENDSQLRDTLGLGNR